MPELKEAFIGLLSSAYEMDEQGVASLFNEDGVPVDDISERLKELDVNRVTKLRNGVDAQKQEQYKFGERKAHEAWEKALKAHGVKSDKRGPELIDDLIAMKSPKAEVNDEVVKTHPLFRNLEAERDLFKANGEKALEDARKEWDATFQRERTLSDVTKYGVELAKSLKPVGLPKDPAKQDAFLMPLVSKLQSLSYQEQDLNGKRTFLPLKKDGGRLEDQHGNQVKLETYIKDTVGSIWDLEQGSERQSAGDPNKGAGTATTVDIPTDPTARAKFMFDLQRDPSFPKEKIAQILEQARKM